MLSNLYQALVSHLSGLEAPVHQADCVPRDAAFPYVTMTLDAPPAPGSPGQATLTIWCLGDGAHAQRLRLADALLALLPARGLYLSLPEGAVTLRMNPSALARPLQDGEALGLRLTWELQCFPNL